MSKKSHPLTIYNNNTPVDVEVGDIIILSPATFGDPEHFQFGKVTNVQNPDTDDPNFQIRTSKHFWDFQNHYTVLGAYRPIKDEIHTQFINLEFL
jgi:hypothetical protein